MRLLIMSTLIALAPAAAISQPAITPIAAPSGNYKVDLAHASIVFRVSHMGLSNYAMRFAKFDSTVAYDAADPTKSKLTVTIDPKSIRTDFPFPERENFDEVLATGEGWLNAGQHPEIRFVSREIRRTGDKTGRVIGDLTLRGVTKPITLDATFNGAINHPMRKVPVMGVSATGSFKRSDFGMSQAAPFVGDDVTVVIEAEYGPQ